MVHYSEMKKFLISAASLGTVFLPLSAQDKTTAVWIPETATLEKNTPLRTVIRMEIEEGWHTYWKNPGMGGLPLNLEARLPEGWRVGEIQYPAPIRFKTGELPGFGYEGVASFAVTLQPPEGAKGKFPPIAAELSWLVCDDSACVPGSAELKLATAPRKALVAAAYDALPKPVPGASLRIGASAKGDRFLSLRLTLPENSGIDPSGLEVFPATPEVIDAGAGIRFEADPETPRAWTAQAEKSEYLSGAPERVSIVLKSASGAAYEISSDTVENLP